VFDEKQRDYMPINLGIKAKKEKRRDQVQLHKKMRHSG
jgi:hypothetical protein